MKYNTCETCNDKICLKTKRPCAKINRILQKETTSKRKREVLFDNYVIDNFIAKNSADRNEFTYQDRDMKSRYKDNTRYIRGTFIDKEYARLCKKYYPCRTIK